MKSLELQPTSEQVKETYCRNTIGRNEDLHRFVEILDSVDDCCVIALDGNWGSGKTFFVKQTKMILDTFNPFITIYDSDDDKVIKSVWKVAYANQKFNLQPQICVYYDAWENDNEEDPMLSIVYDIIETVNTCYNFKPDVNLVKIAAAIAETLTSAKVHSLIEAAKQEDPFKLIKKGKSLRESITDFFDSLLPEQGNRLVVFIDELDRCKPSFAIKLLERIKHYFQNERLTFVLSVNINELQNTVKQYYGNEFDACRYLDRFFDLRITLPPANLKLYYQSIGFTNTRYKYDVIAHEVIQQYHFALREIAKYIRLIKIAAYIPTHDNSPYRFSFPDDKGIEFCLVVLVPIMIGLKMYNSTQYKMFIEGHDSSPLIDIMSKNELRFRMCSSLLESNETYIEDDAKLLTVSLNDKLEKVYDALFIQNYQRTVNEISVGDLLFNQETRKILMKTISLLSKYADYS